MKLSRIKIKLKSTVEGENSRERENDYISEKLIDL